MSDPTATEAEDAVAGEIRAVMARNRVTQVALAEQLDVSHAWVSRRLSGDTAITVGDLVRIAGALGADVATFTAPLTDTE